MLPHFGKDLPVFRPECLVKAPELDDKIKKYTDKDLRDRMDIYFSRGVNDAKEQIAQKIFELLGLDWPDYNDY